jgi:uncharacterized protein
VERSEAFCYHSDMADRSAAQIIEELKRLAPRLRAEGVTKLAIFGSRARGDNRPDSDLDVLIDVEQGRKFSLLDLIGVQHIIGDELGIETMAVMNRSLKEDFREEIEPDVRPVF